MPSEQIRNVRLDLEEQVAWLQRRLHKLHTVNDEQLEAAVFASLRRLALLEKVAEAARAREAEDQHFDALPEQVKRGDYIAQMLRRGEVRANLQDALAALGDRP